MENKGLFSITEIKTVNLWLQLIKRNSDMVGKSWSGLCRLFNILLNYRQNCPWLLLCSEEKKTMKKISSQNLYCFTIGKQATVSWFLNNKIPTKVCLIISAPAETTKISTCVSESCFPLNKPEFERNTLWPLLLIYGW